MSSVIYLCVYMCLAQTRKGFILEPFFKCLLILNAHILKRGTKSWLEGLCVGWSLIGGPHFRAVERGPTISLQEFQMSEYMYLFCWASLFLGDNPPVSSERASAPRVLDADWGKRLGRRGSVLGLMCLSRHTFIYYFSFCFMVPSIPDPELPPVTAAGGGKNTSKPSPGVTLSSSFVPPAPSPGKV